MATKAQLKQRCKELEEQLGLVCIDNEHHKAQIAELSGVLKRTKEAETELWHSYQNEVKRAQFYYKCLSKIRHILALDTVEQLTHRLRNEKLRSLVGTIAWWMQTTLYDTKEFDDIPY